MPIEKKSLEKLCFVFYKGEMSPVSLTLRGNSSVIYSSMQWILQIQFIVHKRNISEPLTRIS